MIRASDAKDITTAWNTSDLPVLRGFGNSMVHAVGKCNIEIEIDNVKAKLEVLVVPDNLLSIPLLVGQSYTEQDHIVVYKSNNELKIRNKIDKQYPISLFAGRDETIENISIIDVYSKPKYDGEIYFEQSLRQEPGKECEFPGGIIKLTNGHGQVYIKQLSQKSFPIKRDTMILKATPAFETKEYFINRVENVRMIDRDQITKDILRVNQGLDEQYVSKLVELLNDYRDCFAFSIKELGCCNTSEMDIKLQDVAPVVYRPYRMAHAERAIVRDMIQELEEAGIVRQSMSNYASPILLVRKKTGDHRLCIDFRALNKKTVKEHYPLPRIDDQLDNLSGFKYYTTLDLASGYYQIPLTEQSKKLTAFITPDGLYEFNRMPFGLSNAPATFQRTINQILGNARFQRAFAYMDDIVIPSKDINEGFETLQEILKMFKNSGLTLNLDKCNFFMTSIEYLGFEVDEGGIRPGQKKILAVENFPTPTDQHRVRQFLGLASFFRRFVKGFSIIAKPLTHLLKRDVKFVWSEDQENAFQNLKATLTKRPILAYYNPAYETQLHTDASKIGVAGILLQRKNKDTPFQAVAYYSRQTSPEEMHFSSYDLETLAVVSSLQRFRVYLLGIRFEIVTDCNSLRATFEKRDVLPRVARWWNIIQEYDFSIVYKPGKNMSHVDALSRNPVNCDSLEVRSITVDWILTVQQNDSEVRRIIDILNDKTINNAVEITKNFVIKRGLLYRLTEKGIKWVVPKGVRWQVLKANHDDIGHFSLDKTLERIQQSYWFPKMRRFVKKYVESCLECANTKVPSAKKAGELHPIPKISQPFHTVHTDHLGPFVRSKHNNTHALLMIDAFTKFLVIVPVKSTKTCHTIKALKTYFHTFGVPKRLISDRGTSFTSKSFSEFITGLGVTHVLNAVATPRANGQIERYNRTFLSALAACTQGKSEKSWDDCVLEIQWGINNTFNKGIGKTPAQALFGTNLVGTSDSKLRLQIDSADENDEVDRDRIRHEVSEHIRKNQEKQKERFDKGRKRVVYEEGDLVRIEREVQSTGQSKKLIPKVRGPYRITKVLGQDRYEVQDTPISRKNNRPFKSVFPVDKIHPWLVFKRTDDSDYSDKSSEADE